MPPLTQKSSELILWFRERKKPASLDEILKGLSWPRSSFFRVLKDARKMQQIEFDPTQKLYKLVGPIGKIDENWKLGTLDLLILADRALGIKSPSNQIASRSLRTWVERQLREQGHNLENLQGRIRFAPVHWRPDSENLLPRIAEALLRRRVIQFDFHDAKGIATQRLVSPQRLVMYRSGWSLDCWDHGKNDLRQFPLDQILNVRFMNKAWREVSYEELDRVLAVGYGFWAGKVIGIACIQFTGIAAHYARREVWHPQQTMKDLGRRGVILEFPYSGLPELVGDILRWGEEAEVLGDERLKEAVRDKIRKMAGR